MKLNVSAHKIKSQDLQDITQKKLTTKDIHKILSLPCESGSKEDKVLTELEHSTSSDPGAIIGLVIDEKGELEGTYIQTSSMRATAQKFPELIVADTTYNTNNKKMPLSTLMVVDGKGHGQVVTWALLSNEKIETLQSLFCIPKETNDSSSQIYVVHC